MGKWRGEWRGTMETEKGDGRGMEDGGGTVEGERSYLLDSFSSGCFYQQGVRWYLYASRYASSFPPLPQKDIPQKRKVGNFFFHFFLS
jgi:hypothetical protein